MVRITLMPDERCECVCVCVCVKLHFHKYTNQPHIENGLGFLSPPLLSGKSRGAMTHTIRFCLESIIIPATIVIVEGHTIVPLSVIVEHHGRIFSFTWAGIFSLKTFPWNVFEINICEAIE